MPTVSAVQREPQKAPQEKPTAPPQASFCNFGRNTYASDDICRRNIFFVDLNFTLRRKTFLKRAEKRRSRNQPQWRYILEIDLKAHRPWTIYFSCHIWRTVKWLTIYPKIIWFPFRLPRTELWNKWSQRLTAVVSVALRLLAAWLTFRWWKVFENHLKDNLTFFFISLPPIFLSDISFFNPACAEWLHNGHGGGRKWGGRSSTKCN